MAELEKSGNDSMPPVYDVCPTCKRKTVVHSFMTNDGITLRTYHCVQHKDVVPMRSAVYNDY